MLLIDECEMGRVNSACLDAGKLDAYRRRRCHGGGSRASPSGRMTRKTRSSRSRTRRLRLACTRRTHDSTRRTICSESYKPYECEKGAQLCHLVIVVLRIVGVVADGSHAGQLLGGQGATEARKISDAAKEAGR